MRKKNKKTAKRGNRQTTDAMRAHYEAMGYLDMEDGVFVRQIGYMEDVKDGDIMIFHGISPKRGSCVWGVYAGCGEVAFMLTNEPADYETAHYFARHFPLDVECVKNQGKGLF